MSATHTPGPWEAYHAQSAGWSVRRQYERPGYTGLAPICSLAWWQFDIPGIIDYEISGANARLIAAAPDLLAACELIARFCNADGSPCDGFRFREGIAMARAAIARASSQ